MYLLTGSDFAITNNMLIKIILRPFHPPSASALSLNTAKASNSRWFSTRSHYSSSSPANRFQIFGKSKFLSSYKFASSYQIISYRDQSTMAQIDLAVNTQSGCVEFTIPPDSTSKEVLTPNAIVFLKKLHQNFEPRRQEILKERARRQKAINDGKEILDFLPQTKHIREDPMWTIAPLPPALQRRRVEITGPVDRKMVINALNSGADSYMADFEDSTAPTWNNQLTGQINLKDAIRKKIDFVAPNGKEYKLEEEVATLLVRPRGWHLDEKHILIDGERLSGSLFDFGLYFFHNGDELLKRGLGPYFYLPKLQSHLEARLWNDVFRFSQDELGIPQGTIKATVLIETIMAAFEMEEILYELREHSSGLNAGRWDYIFSCIKTYQKRSPQTIQGPFSFPDRSQITMNSSFMRAYCLSLVQTCHKRRAPAIG